ncbi:hypothetical protein JMA_05530 [Jeotgalibacillus malaysiensis]|uniref:Uncharacterized protein n=1 Tax=Jeotgalibacillus malaysiensis TaxID=1508404 RepID=A0A0B5AHL1_9BACL|nr:hypothetical protein [Jeotgalibacillus malaysiensis]AJD89870.1 hypothetical protein JMA_05530 [Jeotgalibacillus malaysiensis]
MTAAQKGMIAIGLTVLSGVLAIQGYNLMETLEVRDGAGTGVYFLFFEINDRVIWSDVAGSAYGFWTASLIVFLTAVLVVKSVKVNNLFLSARKS